MLLTHPSAISVVDRKITRRSTEQKNAMFILWSFVLSRIFLARVNYLQKLRKIYIYRLNCNEKYRMPVE